MSFEDVMMKRLASCHSEACDEILAGVKSGRSLSDAVSDAIEALPTRKSRDLRRWLEDWEAWEEWQGWKKQGWTMRRTGNEVEVKAPNLVTHPNDGPSRKAVAAGAGVAAVKYAEDGTNGGAWDAKKRPYSYFARYNIVKRA